MQLQVLRKTFTGQSTIGELLVDGQFECFTLEDVVRPEKIFGETAIPDGSYRVVVTMSPRFKRRLPLLVDVPGYTGVRIHPGNTRRDTLGCLLVGRGKAKDVISGSQVAFAALLQKIEKAALTEEVIIELVNEGSPIGAVAGRATRGGARGATRSVVRAAGTTRLASRPVPTPI
jgi:hypothetical protein